MTVEPASPAASPAPLIRLQGGRLGYRRGAEILGDVDLAVERGEFLGIVGPNGSGKTTLLRAILGITPLLGGTLETSGRLGYSPQRSVLDPIYPFSAAEVVGMGLLGLPEAPDRAARMARITQALEACGMADRAAAHFRDLSGGQKQRVLVARALVAEPDVLILDEPTNDLDLAGEHEVMELLRRLHEDGRTIVMVTHMLYLVARYAARVALIDAGRLRAGEGLELLSAESLSGLYGIPVVVGEVEGERVIAAPREARAAGGDE